MVFKKKNGLNSSSSLDYSWKLVITKGINAVLFYNKGTTQTKGEAHEFNTFDDAANMIGLRPLVIEPFSENSTEMLQIIEEDSLDLYNSLWQ